MAGINDVLVLNVTEVSIIKNRYPDAILTRESDTRKPLQKYKLILPDEDENADSYYNFLLDNLIAMCSRKFHARLSRDKQFRLRIRARADANLRKIVAESNAETTLTS